MSTTTNRRSKIPWKVIRLYSCAHLFGTQTFHSELFSKNGLKDSVISYFVTFIHLLQWVFLDPLRCAGVTCPLVGSSWSSSWCPLNSSNTLSSLPLTTGWPSGLPPKPIRAPEQARTPLMEPAATPHCPRRVLRRLRYHISDNTVLLCQLFN